MRTRPLAALAASLLALAACSDAATGPGAAAPQVAARGTALVATFTCRQDMVKGTSQCDPAGPSLPDGVRGYILAGSDFSLLPHSTSYNSTTEIASHRRYVKNQFNQDIGTSDGITVDPIRVFVISGPNVTGGTGSADVRNPDGYGTFTASGQPYWNVPEIVTTGLFTSSNYLWEFDVDNTVTSWEYTVALEAPIPFPYGWVGQSTTGGQGTTLNVSQTNQWSATHYNARGTPISGVTFTWSSSDPSVATVSSTGLVTAVSVGTARIYATSSSNGVVGSANVYVS